MIDEGVAKAALDAKKLAVQAIDVAIARHDAHQLIGSRAQRHLAAVRTIRDRPKRLRPRPGPRLVAVSSIQQSSSRTDLDAVAALRTVQPVTVGTDNRVRAAI